MIIPPTSNPSTAAFSVAACPVSSNDPPGHGHVLRSAALEFAPAASIPPRSTGTTYYVHMRLDAGVTAGTRQIFNNHIPLDLQFTGSLTISKTTPMLNVSRGQLVPYVITVNNTTPLLVTDVSIVDRFPAGFTYRGGLCAS